MLVVVTPAADRVPGHPQEFQKDPNDHQDDPQRQEDRNGGDQPDDQQNNAENDHEPLFVVGSVCVDPWIGN
jgi:hypothetical protein